MAEYTASLRAVVDPTGAVQGSQKASQAIQRMGNAAQTSTQKVQAQSTALDRMSAMARKAALAVGGLFTAMAAQRAFTSAIKLASSYQAELQKVVGLVGVAQTEVDGMGESILRMATAVGRTPQELAQGLFFVTSAGARGKEAMDILESSAKAASAGLGSTVAVADAVTSAVNAYASSGMTAAKATGILVAAVREGKASAEEIAGSLGQVLGIASAVGVSFDQVAASVAAMTRVGINSAEAVTSLKATLNAIYNPSTQSAKAFEQMGLSVEELRRSLSEDGLLPTLQKIGAATNGNNALILEAIPNIRAMGAVFTLLGDNAEGVRGIFEALAKETGQSLDTAFLAASETSEKKFKNALAGLQVEAIKLGMQALPSVTEAAKTLTKYLPIIGESIGKIVSGFIMFAKAALAIWAAHKAVTALNIALAWTKAASGIGFVSAIAMEFSMLSLRAKAAAVSLKAVNVQLFAVGAAVAGWQFGTWLRKEFTIVEVLGNELFGSLMRGWNNVTYLYKAGTLAIKYNFQRMIGDVKMMYADFLRLMASGLELSKFKWAQETAAGLRGMADGMKRGIMTSTEYEKQMDKLAAKRVADNADVTDFVLMANLEAEARGNVADAVEKQANAMEKLTTTNATAKVSLDYDEKALEKLQGLFDNLMPDESKRAEMESALLFVDDALGRIEQKVSRGLPAALNGIPVGKFVELREAIQDALEDLDPLEQAARDTATAYSKLVDDTRTPLEQLYERKSELYELELKMMALYPEQAALIKDTVERGLADADERYAAWLKSQEKTDATTERLKDGAKSLGMTFSSAFEDAVVAGKNLGDILKGLEQDIIRIIMRMLVTEPMANALTGMISTKFGVPTPAGGGPGTYSGGKVGSATWVGEHGRELIVQGKGAGARVLSHSDSMRIAREAASGNSGSVHVAAPIVNVPATKVEVHQYGGSEPAQIETSQQPDGSQLIKVLVNTFNKDLAQNGPMSRAMRTKFNLQQNLAVR